MLNHLKVTIFFFLICQTAFPRQDTVEQKILKTFHTISSHDLLDFVAELSSPKYDGRLSGSPGYQKAAGWVADKFKEWGIEPANEGSYFQNFDNAYTEVLSIGELIWYKKNTGRRDSVIQFHFPEDYFPGSNSASGKIKGDVVYAGFGITANDLRYDDYAGQDVKGKIVMLESGVPYTKNDSVMGRWTPYAYHRYKFQNAIKHGAVGLLYVGKLANPNTSWTDRFIYAHIDVPIAEAMFRAAGKSYSDHKKNMAANFTSGLIDLGQTVSISASTRNHHDSKSCNVVGLIRGTDPVVRDEVIILGGHLDGQGNLGGTIFPSALDNASGIADIMGAAKALASSGIKLKRSVLFIGIGGEECGLYGSYLYTEKPLFEKKKTVCMVNLDMVGNGTGFFLSSGLSYPALYKYFSDANNKYIHRSLQASEKRKDYGRPRSDAAVFEKAGFPTFGLWTSGSVKPVYYHHPKDNTDALTPEIMEDAAKLLYLGVIGLANY
jgi:hypothetical protein